MLVALQLDITSQCALCGQLVGMFLFFTHMAGSPPIIFKLTRRKFAIKQLGRLLLVCIVSSRCSLAVQYQTCKSTGLASRLLFFLTPSTDLLGGKTFLLA